MSIRIAFHLVLPVCHSLVFNSALKQFSNLKLLILSVGFYSLRNTSDIKRPIR